MSAELPSKRDALITSTINESSEQVHSNATLQLEEFQEVFSELDSQLQAVQIFAYALENDQYLPRELRMSENKRREMDEEFRKRAVQLGVTSSRKELLEVGGYDSNGTNILTQREKILSTGEMAEHKILEFPIVDTEQQLDTIGVAAD